LTYERVARTKKICINIALKVYDPDLKPTNAKAD